MRKVRFILVLFLFPVMYGGVALAQWVQTNGPYGSTIISFTMSPNRVSGTNFFAGTLGGGIWMRPISEMIYEAKGIR
jgi:hypothetical protein